jgi:hypothetical protein
VPANQKIMVGARASAVPVALRLCGERVDEAKLAPALPRSIRQPRTAVHEKRQAWAMLLMIQPATGPGVRQQAQSSDGDVPRTPSEPFAAALGIGLALLAQASVEAARSAT